MVGGGVNFLDTPDNSFDGDILTNPPYKLAQEFVEKAISAITDGHKVIMFLKLQFLESQERRELWKKHPPMRIYVSSSRLVCAKDGDFVKNKYKNAIAYCWYVWQKGYGGETILKWFN